MAPAPAPAPTIQSKARKKPRAVPFPIAEPAQKYAAYVAPPSDETHSDVTRSRASGGSCDPCASAHTIKERRPHTIADDAIATSTDASAARRGSAPSATTPLIAPRNPKPPS